MITIIDYGAGNLSSVDKAFRKLGRETTITSDPSVVESAAIIVLPGVGAAGDAMKSLHGLGLIEPIKESITRGVPFFGICLGMQVLLTETEESGGQRCLGVVPGFVRLLSPELKVPHIGWNQVHQQVRHPLFEGIPDKANFYFVHSYYPDPGDQNAVAGTTEYGAVFCSAIAQDNILATQFHPEKSGNWGLRLLRNFLRFADARK